MSASRDKKKTDTINFEEESLLGASSSEGSATDVSSDDNRVALLQRMNEKLQREKVALEQEKEKLRKEAEEQRTNAQLMIEKMGQQKVEYTETIERMKQQIESSRKQSSTPPVVGASPKKPSSPVADIAAQATITAERAEKAKLVEENAALRRNVAKVEGEKRAKDVVLVEQSEMIEQLQREKTEISAQFLKVVDEKAKETKEKEEAKLKIVAKDQAILKAVQDIQIDAAKKEKQNKIALQLRANGVNSALQAKTALAIEGQFTQDSYANALNNLNQVILDGLQEIPVVPGDNASLENYKLDVLTRAGRFVQAVEASRANTNSERKIGYLTHSLNCMNELITDVVINNQPVTPLNMQNLYDSARNHDTRLFNAIMGVLGAVMILGGIALMGVMAASAVVTAGGTLPLAVPAVLTSSKLITGGAAILTGAAGLSFFGCSAGLFSQIRSNPVSKFSVSVADTVEERQRQDQRAPRV